MPQTLGPEEQEKVFRLLISADLSELTKVRRLMQEVGGAARLSAERLFDLKVTASEAAANAVEHAASEVEVVARILSDRLTVEVTNRGVFRPGPRADGELRPRGLGLPLMVSLADQVLVSRLSQDRTEVLLTFFLGDREHAAERKRAEEALSDSEDRMSFALELSRTGAWELDLSDHTARRSLGHDRIFGYESLLPEWTYEMFLDHVVPGDRAVVDQKFKAALADREDLNFECRIRRADGDLRWIWAAGRHRPGEAGAWRMTGIIQDITERKRVEDELQASKRRAELTARTAESLLTSADPQTLVEDLCREVMAELDCHVFFNYLGDDEEPRLHLNAYWGINEEEARSIEWLDYGTAVCGHVAQTATPMVAEEIPSTPDPRTDLVESFGVQAYACHPLVYQGIVLGTLSFGSRSRTRFSEGDLLIMRAVSDQVAVAMARVRTGRAMAETGRALERAQAVAKMGSWWLDTRLDRLLWSQETYRIFGIPAGTPLTYETFLARVHPEDRQEVEGAWAAAMTGIPYDIEHRVMTRDAVKWVRETAEIDFDSEGRPVGGFGIVHGITERRAAEEALRASLERQALAQRATRTGFWDWDMTTGSLSWSPELFDLFGLDPTLEPTFDLWLRVIHEEDRQRAMDTINQAVEEHVSLENEYRIQLADGHERWISALGDTSYDPDGRPQRMLGICIDITDRKQSETERERLRVQEQALAAGVYARSLIEAALDPLVTISPEGKITDVNEATVKITGRERGDLIGTDFSDYFTDPASARRGYHEVFAKGSVTDYPLTIRDQNGELTDVLYNASLYSDAEGNVLGVFAAARDITALKELEEQRSISAMLQETLLDVPREFPGLRYGHLYRSATHGARVGGDFYDVSRVKGGRFAVLIGDVSGHGVEAARIATLVKDVVHAFSHQFQHPHLVLRKTNDLLIEKETPGFVTLFLGVLDPLAGMLTYCSAGHPNALLRSAGGTVTLLEAAAAPLGVFSAYSWKEARALLSEKDLLFLYTDGAMEARRDGGFFGQERLADALKRWSDLSPGRLPEAVLDEVLAFSGGHLVDDVALLALQLTRDR